MKLLKNMAMEKGHITEDSYILTVFDTGTKKGQTTMGHGSKNRYPHAKHKTLIGSLSLTVDRSNLKTD